MSLATDMQAFIDEAYEAVRGDGQMSAAYVVEACEALLERVQKVEVLVSDWQANSGSRSLGDPTADTWNEAARQLLDALGVRS